MKTFGLCVLLVCSWGLAFFAGRMFPPEMNLEELEVVFVDGEGRLPEVSIERQVLALVGADPREDAEVAFWTKDFRMVVFSGRGLDPSEVKITSFIAGCGQNQGQAQVMGIVERYAKAYNERMKELTEWDQNIQRTKPHSMAPRTP